MSPSRPRKSPRIASSSTSRSRCTMTCRAVEAAIRPKPVGVSSNSGPSSRRGSLALVVDVLGGSSRSSRAHTMTWPVLRSSSTRASRLVALGAVVGDEQRLLDRGDEHVEARSPARARGRAGRPCRCPSSALLLSSGRANSTCTRPRDAGIRQRLGAGRVLLRGRHLEHDLGRPTPIVTRPVTSPPSCVDRDEAADVAAEVARLGERSADTGRGDLEDVGLLPHDVGGVEGVADEAGRLGDLVERERVRWAR